MRIPHAALAATAAVGLVVAGGSAFTAANTNTPVTSAGQESTVTSGFAVSNVEYTLGAATAAATGDLLASVSFTLTATTGGPDGDNNVATQARVQLVDADGYFACAIDPGATAPAVDFVCTTPSQPVNEIDTLDIVAISNSAA